MQSKEYRDAEAAQRSGPVEGRDDPRFGSYVRGTDQGALCIDW